MGVETNNGIIHLTGEVATGSTNPAASLAEEVKGAEQVVNNLRVTKR